MLLNTSKTFAYKCDSCGIFGFSSISIFDIYKCREYEIFCTCGNKVATIKSTKNVETNIYMDCTDCGREHIYKFDIKSLTSNRAVECKCPRTGIYIGLIGEDAEVRQRIDKLEEELDDLMSMYGYDNYFKNTQVMLQTLNKIHDIAEEGRLLCECGSSDVELILLSDMIYLKCRKCPGLRKIYAASNSDLKSILKAQNILLSSKTPR